MTIDQIKNMNDRTLVQAIERRCKERLHASKVETAALLGLGKSSWYRYLSSDTPVLSPSNRLLFRLVLTLPDTQLRQMLDTEPTPAPTNDPVADLL